MSGDPLSASEKCGGCKLPVPASWCWEQRLIDCPSDKPPRNMDALMLWECVRDLVKRVRKLESVNGHVGFPSQPQG